MRQRTSKARRHRHHVKVLKSEVMSPRIAWFQFLGWLRALAKAALAAAVLFAVIYGIRQAIEHTFHRNPDFVLKEISLNENNALDEADLVEMLGINLDGNIFDFDVDAMEAQLLEQPAISAARVERKLPGTLSFQVTARRPAAWIACPEEGFPASRESGSLVVDHEGFAYPCPPAQVEACRHLPVITLAKDESHPVQAGRTLEHPQYRKCLRLLKAIVAECPDELPMVESISQANEWSLKLVTRSGTEAIFGLGDHPRQLEYLGRALDHARVKGYEIGTINLIPRRNVPITTRGEAQPPRAIPVIEEPSPATAAPDPSNDIRTLLNRN